MGLVDECIMKAGKPASQFGDFNERISKVFHRLPSRPMDVRQRSHSSHLPVPIRSAARERLQPKDLWTHRQRRGKIPNSSFIFDWIYYVFFVRKICRWEICYFHLLLYANELLGIKSSWRIFSSRSVTNLHELDQRPRINLMRIDLSSLLSVRPLL